MYKVELPLSKIIKLSFRSFVYLLRLSFAKFIDKLKRLLRLGSKKIIGDSSYFSMLFNEAMLVLNIGILALLQKIKLNTVYAKIKLIIYRPKKYKITNLKDFIGVSAKINKDDLYSVIKHLTPKPETKVLIFYIYVFLELYYEAKEYLIHHPIDVEQLNNSDKKIYICAILRLAVYFSEQEKLSSWQEHDLAPQWASPNAPSSYDCNLIYFESSFNYSKHEFNLLVLDKCPSCGFEYNLDNGYAFVPWLSNINSEKWLCPSCLAQRTWNVFKAKQDAWSFYQNLLLQLTELSKGKKSLIFAVLLVMLGQSLAAIALIRFGRSYNSAIGHQTFDVAGYFAERLNHMHPVSLDYIDFYSGSVNDFITKRWENTFAFLEILQPEMQTKLSPFTSLAFDIVQRKQNRVDFVVGRDKHNFLQQADIPWCFAGSEMEFGYSKLEQMGLPRNAQFVCLLVRDDIYDSQERTTTFYYPHRNADINTYQLAMEYLVDKGYYIIRMGASVETSLTWKSKFIIDYASDFRTHFMDVWLMAQCDFVVTTGAGLDAIATILKKPLLYTNFSFIFWENGNYDNVLLLFKHFFNIRSRQDLSLKEIIINKYADLFYDKEFKHHNIGVRNNTPEEILEAVQEMYERINGTKIYSDPIESCQKRFWETLATYVPSFPYYAPNYRISEKQLVDDPDFGIINQSACVDTIKRTPLPWGKLVQTWRPSAEQIQSLVDHFYEVSPHKKEAMLLCTIWLVPNHSEVYHLLMNIYIQQNRMNTALYFAYLAHKSLLADAKYFEHYAKLLNKYCLLHQLAFSEISLSKFETDILPSLKVDIDKNLFAKLNKYFFESK